MKTIHPAVAEHVIEENCRLREALRRIADLPIDPCSTENDYRLSGAKAIAEGALSQQAEPVRSPGTEDAATMLANGSQEPAPEQDELVVYRAVNQFGSDCHFGVESLARVWAGPKGTVERVTLKPAPDLSVVAVRPEQQQPIRLPQRADTSHGDAFDTQLAEAYNAALDEVARLNAAPIAQTAAQSEFGDAYQGAREDLAIWKRRALEAEQKVRHQEQVVDHLIQEAQGETRMGEPVIPQTAERDRLRALIAECAEYLNTDRETTIGSGSILHRQMIAAMAAKDRP